MFGSSMMMFLEILNNFPGDEVDKLRIPEGDLTF